MQKFGETVQVLLFESNLDSYLTECHQLICDELVALPREKYDTLLELQLRAKVIKDLQSMIANLTTDSA